MFILADMSRKNVMNCQASRGLNISQDHYERFFSYKLKFFIAVLVTKVRNDRGSAMFLSRKSH